MPSPEGGKAINGTVKVAKFPRHKAIVSESSSITPPINRSALFLAARTSANSSGGKQPSPIQKAIRWKHLASTGILVSVGWYNSTILPKEHGREDMAFSRVSVKVFSSLIHRA